MSETVLRDFNRALLVALRLSDAGVGGIALGFQERAVQELAREVHSCAKRWRRRSGQPQSQQPVRASPAPAAVSVTNAAVATGRRLAQRTYQREVEIDDTRGGASFSRYRYQSWLKSISDGDGRAVCRLVKGFLHHQNELAPRCARASATSTQPWLINRQGGLRLVLSPAHAASLALLPIQGGRGAERDPWTSNGRTGRICARSGRATCRADGSHSPSPQRVASCGPSASRQPPALSC